MTSLEASTEPHSVECGDQRLTGEGYRNFIVTLQRSRTRLSAEMPILHKVHLRLLSLQRSRTRLSAEMQKVEEENANILDALQRSRTRLSAEIHGQENQSR